MFLGNGYMGIVVYLESFGGESGGGGKADYTGVAGS